MPSMKKPTAAQRRVLQNMANGRPAHAGLRTQSEWGGLNNTLLALSRRGWIDRKGDITDAGREALASS